MAILDDLFCASNNVASLQYYLSDNYEEIYDLFAHQAHSELIILRGNVDRYIQLNRNVILSLNTTNNTNLAFISLLLDISEELGLIASFRFLYDFLFGEKFNIGERLKAASLYLIGITTIDDYLNRYDAIYKHLQLSFEREEDNKNKVLMTLVNYYSQVLHDFGQFNICKINALKEKIEKSLSDFEYSFLNSDLIADVLSVDLQNFEKAYEEIHSLLDSFLGRYIVRQTYNKGFLLEEGTKYSVLITEVKNNFKDIRQISVNLYLIVASDSIFNSLGRGVTIITEEAQLFAYMHSYGNMHYEKLNEAFKALPKSLFSQETNIIDWGCGQAIASMTYIDFLSINKINQAIKNITLIEPSEMALKRGALHIKKFDRTKEIHTINKDMDSLIKEDFKKNKTHTHIHLFSNILDINEYSLTSLLKLVESNFQGNNYFICVSPYINDTRTSRLNAFINYFSNKMDQFSIYQTIDNKSGEWKGSWTRVVRVFKVSLGAF